MEHWRDIPSYEGLYQVSDEGNVRSLDRVCNNRILRGKDLSKQLTKTGYYMVNLSKDGVATKFFVHRLVASAFLPKRPDLDYVDHINGIRNDNAVKNLRWVSCADNRRNANRLGNLPKRYRRVRRSDGMEYESMSAAARALGVTKCAVIYHVNHHTKSCCGYTFTPIDDE